MKNSRLFPSFLVAATVAVVLLTVARADESETSTVKFSNPAKPGVLRVNVSNGDIHVRGTDAASVTVQTDLKPDAPAPRQDGLRVLTSSATYSLTEHDNVVSLVYGSETWSNGSGDFTIAVPRNTTVIVSNALGGDISIADITGAIEVKSLNGEVTLGSIAGSALVETINGKIKATVRDLVAGKPLSFTSMNGEVVLHLPAAAKANVSLRTHNGSILTDFDEKTLVTKTESVGAPRRMPRTVPADDRDAEIKAAVHEAVRVSVQAAHEAAVAMKEAAIAARDAARRNRAANEADDDDDETVAPVAPLAPMAPLPPMTGGKIVTGTLNGGGPEIRITTMNGDVVLRKIAVEK